MTVAAASRPTSFRPARRYPLSGYVDVQVTPTRTVRVTRRPLGVLEFVEQYTAKYGWPPTWREIGDELGGISTNAVDDHIWRLSKKGLLAVEANKCRTLRSVRIQSTPEWCRRVIQTTGRHWSPELGRVVDGEGCTLVPRVWARETRS